MIEPLVKRVNLRTNYKELKSEKFNSENFQNFYLLIFSVQLISYANAFLSVNKKPKYFINYIVYRRR